VLKGLTGEDRLVAFRYHDVMLLKNQSSKGIVVRGRPLRPGAFCRVYSGQRIVLGEQVLTHQDLAYYFNAKKNVSLTQIYLAIDNNDEVQLEKVRTRESVLEVCFGLKVKVRALRDVDALLNGVALRANASVEATLDDKIVFHNDSELPLSDLRRRAVRSAAASSSGLQERLSRLEQSVAARRGRHLLSPGTSGEVLLKILCDYENKVGRLEVLQADRPIMVGDLPVRGTHALKMATPSGSISGRCCGAISPSGSSRKSGTSSPVSRCAISRIASVVMTSGWIASPFLSAVARWCV
jgi:hypothetical protein